MNTGISAALNQRWLVNCQLFCPKCQKPCQLYLFTGLMGAMPADPGINPTHCTHCTFGLNKAHCGAFRWENTQIQTHKYKNTKIQKHKYTLQIWIKEMHCTCTLKLQLLQILVMTQCLLLYNTKHVRFSKLE